MTTTAKKKTVKLGDILVHAAQSTTEGITVADPSRPDRPLIYVNKGFEKMTGYSREETIGRNCRFLQGPGTSPAAVDHIRQTVRTGGSCVVQLLNYRKDGKRFWNRLAIVPIKSKTGKVLYFVGIQADLTAERSGLQQIERSQVLHDSVEAYNDVILSLFTHLQFFREQMNDFSGIPQRFLDDFDQSFDNAMAGVQRITRSLNEEPKANFPTIDDMR